MKILKIAAVAGLVAALTGCGGDSASDKPAAKSGAAPTAAAKSCAPAIPENALASLAFVANGSESLKPILSAVEKCFKQGMDIGLGAAGEDAAEAKAFMEKAGIGDANVDWAVVSVLSANIEEGDVEVAAAIACSVDLDKVVAAVNEMSQKEEQKDVFKSAEVGGMKAYKVSKDEDVPCDVFALSLEGKVAIVANSEAGAQKMIALYKEGKGADKSFGGFTSADFIRLYIPDLGGVIAQNPAASGNLAAVDMMIPEGSRMIKAFKAVDFALAASDKVEAKISVVAGGANDADTLATSLNSFVVMAKGSIPEEDTSDEAVMAREMFSTLEIKADGDKLLASVELTDKVLKTLSAEMLKGAGLQE